MTVSTGVGRGRRKGSTNKPKKVPGQKDIRNLFNQPSLPTQRDAGEGSSAQVFPQEQLSDPVEESSRSDLNNTIPVPNAFDDAYSSDASGDEDIFINGEDFPEWLPDKIVLDDEIAGQEQEDSVIFDYLQRLKAKIKRNVMPDEYKRGTLWVNPPSPCFALKGEADPTSLYLPRVCLWFPHHLTQEKLKCPTCGSSLESKGIATDPTARKIIDIDDCFYIMTYRYECTSESLLHQQSGPNKSLRSFRGYNEAIMNQLPFRVQAEFPACLSKKSGISVMLLNMLRPFVQNSVGPVRLSKILRELHMLRYDKVKLQYLDAAVYRTKNPTLNMMAQTHWRFPKFSEFQDPKKYAGAFPSASYLKYMYTFTMKFFKPLIDAEMLKLGESTPTSSETDYRLRHNADVGRKNRYGKLYKNHYNPWTTQVINHLEESLGMPSNASYFDPYCDALKFRGNDVSSAKLSFGICPFPTDLMEQLQMHAFTFSSMPDNHVAKVVLPNERLLSDERALITATFLPFVFARRCPLNQYEFLALCQGTKYAVTPVHTEQEKTLYHELISQLAATSNRRNPNFLELSQLWTSRCDGVGIFYKSPELLKSYYNITEERSVAKASIHANYASIKEIREVVASSNRPPAVAPTEHTYQRLENAESVYAVRINNQPSLQPSTTASSSSTSTVLPGSVAPQRRFRPIVADPSLELQPSAKKTRAPRTCVRCRNPDCKGKKSISLCTNPPSI